MTSLVDHPDFSDIDRHFAAFITRFEPAANALENPLPALAAATLSRNIRLGHICLDLVAGPAGFDVPLDRQWPDIAAWREALGWCRAVGGPAENKPLIVDAQGRLYLSRYFHYERQLATAILARAAVKSSGPAPVADLQELAIDTALTRAFTVISGGPGTGKTTTVLKILQRLVNSPVSPGGERLRIALAAPTGKAAARLQESLGAGSPTWSASTLHRLLGARSGSVYFRHHSKNPLPVDVVIVDEASMVPLPMMAKLFDAIPPSARVILLGDRFQLASVEPGAVLGDIAQAASAPAGALSGALVVLEKNYRFGAESRIFALCQAVREGEVSRALDLLAKPAAQDLKAQALPSAAKLTQALRAPVLAGFSEYLQCADPARALQLFKRFRLLCAHRSGPFGVEGLNRAIMDILRREGLLSSSPGSPGLPILITQNDYQIKLYNGDIGILLPGPDPSTLAAWFAADDGSLRHFPPARLPAHEPAFAMTVHKSQGSEFEQVLLVLPPKDSPLLTRELVYTGLTRARSQMELWFSPEILSAAISRQVRRSSGLRELLECASPLAL